MVSGAVGLINKTPGGIYVGNYSNCRHLQAV